MPLFAPQSSAHNLPFPGEVRNEIYRYLLPSSQSEHSAHKYKKICGIFGVSRATRQETRIYYYYRTSWRFGTAAIACRFLRGLPVDLYPHIRIVSLSSYPPQGMEDRRLCGLLQKCWNLQILQIRCSEYNFLYERFQERANPGEFGWDSKKLGISRLQGLQFLSITLDEPSLQPSNTFFPPWKF